MTRKTTLASATKPLLSVTEAADMLGYDRATLYRAIRDGVAPFPVIRVRRQMRIPRLAIERLTTGESS